MGDRPPGSRATDRPSNVALSRHLLDAQWSDKGTARRVNQERAARRQPSGYAGANVRGWRQGVVPEPATRAVLAYLLTDELGRRVTESDLGFPAYRNSLGGLAWHTHVDGAIADLGELWNAESDHRAEDLEFALDGYTAPSRDWLLYHADESVARSGRRQIAHSEVDVLWRACVSYQEMERRLGGGHVRPSVVALLTSVISPMFYSGYPDDVGRALMAVAARLTDILGYTAYDGLDHGVAQRYFIQALRLARAADDDSLAAHIFGDMARHTLYVGDVREALALARAGQRAARSGGSPGDEARAACLEAHAHARLGDEVGVARAMHAAEQALALPHPDTRAWIGYFTAEQLQAEFAHVADLAGRPADALEFAALAQGAGDALERRTASLAITVGRAHLALGNLDHAQASAAHVLDLTAPMASRRIAEDVRRLCEAIAGKLDPASAADLVHRSRTTLGAA